MPKLRITMERVDHIVLTGFDSGQMEDLMVRLSHLFQRQAKDVEDNVLFWYNSDVDVQVESTSLEGSRDVID